MARVRVRAGVRSRVRVRDFLVSVKFPDLGFPPRLFFVFFVAIKRGKLGTKFLRNKYK